MHRASGVWSATAAGVAAVWLAGAGGAAAAGAGPGAYTLRDCLARALALNPAAVNARHDLAIAEETIRQARGLVLPNVSADGAYTRLDEVETFTFSDTTYELGVEDSYSAGVGASQLLYSGGKARAALRAGELARRQARWAQRRVQAELARDVRTGFAGILLARREVEVRCESLAQLTELRRQMEDRYAAGKIAEYDLIAARVRLANEAPRLDAASNALQLAVSDFRRLIVLDEGPFEPEGELALAKPARSLDEWLALALDGNPRLHELAVLVSLREQDVAYTRSGAFPELKANANYRGGNSYGFIGGAGDDWEWHWTAGLVLKWDLWNGGTTRAATREREQELIKARNVLADARRAVETEVRRGWLDMELAARTASAGGENVALARKGLAIAEQRTRVGLATYLDFLYAQVALSEASLTHSAALRDHMNAVTRLETAIGGAPAGMERNDE